MTMTLERALEITVAICNRSFHAMGFDQEPFGDLSDVSLAEMVEAVGLVALDNATMPAIDGRRTFHVIPDERLIAAVFALEHYEHATSIASTPATDRDGGSCVRAVHVVQTRAFAQRAA